MTDIDPDEVAMVDRQRAALDAFVQENVELFTAGMECEGTPMIYGAILVLSAIDTGEPGTESILTVRTPGLLHSMRIGLLSWAKAYLNSDEDDD